MKTYRILTLLFVGVFATTLIFAQADANLPLTKKEKKEWKKRKKRMSVEDYRNMYQENSAQKARIASLDSDVSKLEAQGSTKDGQISDLQKQVTRMQAAYQTAQREIEVLKNQLNEEPEYNPYLINGEDFSIGVVFKVQVGAFRKKDLQKYAESSKEFSEEEMEELRRYVIGHFRNYEDANVLKRYLREMGVQDAWIVPYKDNVRVPLKDVLDNGQGE